MSDKDFGHENWRGPKKAHKKRKKYEDPHRIHSVDFPVPVGLRLNIGFKLLAKAGDMEG